MTSLTKERRSFWLGQFHAATGVVPLGAFLVLHLWVNARAMQGRGTYGTLAGKLATVPGLAALELAFVDLPLLFHAGYGIFLMISGTERLPSAVERAHTKTWTRPLQRWTGAVTLAFLGYHLWALPIATALGRLRPSDYYPTLVDTLSSTTAAGIPVAAVVYLFGLAATTYHFANGLATFCLGFGVVTTDRGSRVLSIGCTAVGMALFLLGANTVVYLATGATWP